MNIARYRILMTLITMKKQKKKQKKTKRTSRIYFNRRCGISNVNEYLSGGTKYIESPDKYDNMEQGYEMLIKVGDDILGK